MSVFALAPTVFAGSSIGEQSSKTKLLSKTECVLMTAKKLQNATTSSGIQKTKVSTSGVSSH